MTHKLLNHSENTQTLDKPEFFWFITLFLLLLGPSGYAVSLPPEEELVEVEVPPRAILFDQENNKIPYSKRKDPWGITFSIGANQYKPENYLSAYVTRSVDDDFGKPQDPGADISFGVAKNFSFGSFALEAGASYYQNRADDTNGLQHTLTITPVRFQATLTIDSFMANPYFAPYIFAGAYEMIYKEEEITPSSNATQVITEGETAVDVFYGIGLLLQLNWLDDRSANEAFISHGLENAYIYLEARTFLSPGETEDTPDFGSGFNLGAGLKLEF